MKMFILKTYHDSMQHEQVQETKLSPKHRMKWIKFDDMKKERQEWHFSQLQDQ